MADILTTKERSDRMRLIRAKDTQPELFIRKALFSLGYRYRLHERKLPGCPDIVFPSQRKAIFVHGCFWHRHANCRLARLPKSKLEYWQPKLLLNQKRDESNQRKLKRLGWKLFVVWECQRTQADLLILRVRKFLDATTHIKECTIRKAP